MRLAWMLIFVASVCALGGCGIGLSFPGNDPGDSLVEGEPTPTPTPVIKFLYATNGDGTVSQFRVDITHRTVSALAPATVTVATGANLQGLAVDPQGTGLYVVRTDNNAFYSFRIAASGLLSAVSSAVVGGFNGPGYPVIDATGRYLYAGTATGLDGMVLDPATSQVLSGANDNSTGSCLEGSSYSPDGLSYYMVSSCSTRLYHLTTAGGGSLNYSGEFVITGATPKQVASDPAGRNLYVTNNGAASVTPVSVGGGGTLALNGSDVAAGNQPLGVVVDRTGQCLFVGNYADSTISRYRIAGNGQLTPLGNTALTSSGPRTLLIDSTNTLLFSVNGGSNDLAYFAVDAANCQLSALDTAATGPSPVSIAITP